MKGFWSMNDIFVSYRRSDSSAVVGRVIDRLETRFGEKHIFRDLDSIGYGQNFEDAINRAISECKVCLVIIGDDWLDVRDDLGNRRIDNVKDWVRIEVSSALEQGVHVIPVLVENALMPEKSRLPENLKELSNRNAAKVRDDPDFNIDIERLCSSIQKYLPRVSVDIRAAFTRHRITILSSIFLCLFVLMATFSGGLKRIFSGSSSTTLNGYQLQIKGVELFPASDSASVKVNAFVNGTQFTYPSIGGVEWLQVAPSMAGQTFRLPNTGHYEIRFEMLKKEQGKIAKLLSQETISFTKGSTEDRYGLHGFDPASSTRSGRVSAEIIYSINKIK